MKKKRTYISFDWALKRLLRDKANFDVLEGFLTTLLGEPMKIADILESESNREREESKQNRVDLLARNDGGDLFLIEVQGENEFAYFQRMLFGTSRLVTEHIERGENYDHIKKVYSINIVYFDLGQGKDVIYHGKTEFRGINHNDVLKLSPFQQQKFDVTEVYELYPEYYILKVNDFNRWSKVPLDQWLYFLSTSEIPDDADAPGLKEARKKLNLARMSKEESAAYDRYWMDRHILTNQMVTARGEGLMEGRAQGLTEGRAEGQMEGRAEGRAEEKKNMAKKMLAMGLGPDIIMQATGLDIKALEQL
ncbi:MAG: Rpn family recombination-promoting nuclease/putative transposase [Muribaculaceae bacterium]|nr:Rpn family recombination-promoting nuclease/putative transposase [Muribaculaceae bacterium]